MSLLLRIGWGKAMFGQQFYPTPEKVIHKMVKGLKLRDRRILDPSAGRGDILDAVRKMTDVDYGWNQHKHENLYAIEIDPDLRQVLIGKGYKVIDNNFLTYNGQRYFDIILMNPPFEHGARHLLKAWEISKGATIKCLLNANTLKPDGTQDSRQVQHLVKQFGEIEYLGQPFTAAARSTQVEVALVTLRDTRQKEGFRLDFDPATAGGETYHLDDIQPGELAPANIFENYEARHAAAIAAFKELLAARQKVSYYLDPLLPDHKTGADVISEALNKPNPEYAYEEFLQIITAMAWDSIFSKTKLSIVTTEGVREQIEKMQASQGNMAFTAANMEELFYLLALNKDQIMIQCILEVFDKLTKHYPENRIQVEGWKTNSVYRVGKFILPNIGSVWGNGLDYQAARELDDLEKALCFLSGQKFESISHISGVYSHKNHYGQWIISEFFETKLFQRHTMHFKWRSKKLCDDFNAMVARHRWGWIPEKTKKGVYK